MTKSPRLVASQVLASLLQQQGSLASLLPAAEQSVAEQDRALLKELCFGCCRWHPLLADLLARLLKNPLKKKDADIQALLLMGLYQLQFMRIPSHAAVNECVNTAGKLKKTWAKKLINGVLRQFQRDQTALYQGALAHNASVHPDWLRESIEDAWPTQASEIFAANNQHPPMSLRVNQSQCSREEYLQRLSAEGIGASPSAFNRVGIVLKHPIPVSKLPGFDRGHISVQDEAAQLAADLLELKPHQRVLDACCAPGGKTCHIAEGERQLAALVAIDLEERRLRKVHENLQRLELQATVLCGDASSPERWWDGQPFDRILVDAPCSATGVIRRQPDIKLLRQAEAIDTLCQLQWQILQSLWPLLAEGGILLYATCSLLPRENTQQIQHFVQSQADAEHIPVHIPGGVTQDYGVQLLPGGKGLMRDLQLGAEAETVVDHDGFFYAKLRKRTGMVF